MNECGNREKDWIEKGVIYMIKQQYIRIGLIILYLTEIFFAVKNIRKQVSRLYSDKSGVRRPPP